MSNFGPKRWDHRANVGSLPGILDPSPRDIRSREYSASVGSLPGVARLDGFARVDDFDRTTAYVELGLTVRLHPAAWKAAREGMPITITLSDS